MDLFCEVNVFYSSICMQLPCFADDKQAGKQANFSCF